MRNLFQITLDLLCGLINKLPKIRNINFYLYRSLLKINTKIQYKNLDLKFYIPSVVCNYRVNTFPIKEPRTLDWIEQMELNSIMYDIGANIGLYSVYAAKKNNINVYAFEPSVFNIDQLAKNIIINKVSEKIVIIPLPLSNSSQINKFNMSNMETGGALSTFGEEYDQSGQPLSKKFQYKTLGITLDDIVKLYKLPIPDYIKIDVDGIEHLILSGGIDTIKESRSVMVEVNDVFNEQFNEVNLVMKSCGFKLHEKCNLNTENQYNQWWVK
jgi:FkbM family methyltransferase